MRRRWEFEMSGAVVQHEANQDNVKDPGHSARSAGGRLQLNTHTPYVYTLRMWLCMK